MKNFISLKTNYTVYQKKKFHPLQNAITILLPENAPYGVHPC